MRPEIEYKMWVESPVANVMDQVVEDAKAFSITDDELNRAVLSWVLGRIQEGPIPEWFEKDLNSE